MADPKDEFYREQVFELFRNFNTGLNGLTQKVAALEAVLAAMENDLERMRRVVIDGNGQESMKTTLDRTRERVAGIQEAVNSHRNDFESYRKELSGILSAMESRLKTGQPSTPTHSGPTVAGVELWKVIIGGLVTIASIVIPIVLTADKPDNPDPIVTPQPQEERR